MGSCDVAAFCEGPGLIFSLNVTRELMGSDGYGVIAFVAFMVVAGWCCGPHESGVV